MKILKKIKVIAEGLDFPEGPAFDSTGTLWCVELKGGNLARITQRGLERIPTGGAPNGIAIGDRDEIWFCDAGQCAVRRFIPMRGEFVIEADEVDGQPLAKPNDLAFDAAGRLVFTCPGGSEQAPIGYVCCLTKEGGVRKIAEGFYFPNGVAFAKNGQELILAETRRQRLWRGRWDLVKGTWENPRPWAEVGGRVGPDGLAVGEDGFIYAAIYGGGKIKAVDPEGRVAREFEIPGANPTNCAFDPSGRLGLVVTEAEKGLALNLPWLGPGVPLF